ncbi:MAG: 16S rRNA (guanine(527)-N(7))-methyltransferase RsmG [Erysipelotrichaceae bacterium]
MNIKEFELALLRYNIELSDQQLEQFEKYYEFLIQENQKYNLTAITHKDEVFSKHFYDSLLILIDRDFSGTLVDVGSGAGFPSIPLKILRPDLEIIIIEPLLKRIKFLNELTDLLGLHGVSCLHVRAEDYAYKHKDEYDFVVSRAVANLPILSELCLPLVKKDGYFIALKGIKGLEELDLAEGAISKLAGKIERWTKHNYADQTRINIYIKKINKTPRGYPRKFSLMKKKPL